MKLRLLLFYICMTLCFFPLFHTSVIGIKDPLAPPTIYGESAIVMDADTGDIYYNKNMNRSMYPASITKLMTTLLTIDAFEADDSITFSNSAINSLGYGSSIGIRVGEILTFDQALHGLLLMSSNEAANALAEAHSQTNQKFVEQMNEKATELGAINTHFTNPHGLYDPDHTTTAYDMALITKALLNNDYFLSVMKDTMYQIPPTNKCEETRYLAQQHKMLNNKNDLSIYRDDVIAGKVGYTSESGHTLVTVSDNGNRRLIIVVMKSNYLHIYEDTDMLIDYGYTATALPALSKAGFADNDSIDDYLSDSLSNDGMGLGSDTDSLSSHSDASNQEEGSFFFPIFLTILVVLFLLVGLYLYRLEQLRKRRLEQKRRKYHSLR